MFPHLSGWRVNMLSLQEAASKELLELLEKCEGTKAIVWDESLAGPVGLIAKYTFLKEHGVTKMFPLKDSPLPEFDVKHIIFITRPTLKLMDYIASNILYERKKGKQKEFLLYFVPRRLELCEKHLKTKGVYGSISVVDEFKCHFFPVDNDVISMELKNCYKELHIEGDPTCIHQSAQALIHLQHLYGRIPKIYGKGKYAENLWELTKNMANEDKEILSSEKGPIDQLFILDRSIDLMSVLTTQLTYEGLIDEFYGIKCTTAQFPAEKFTGQTEIDNLQGMTSNEKKSIILNSGENLYTELRDKNFNEVGIILSKNAKVISSQFGEKHGEKTLQQIKELVTEKLPSMLANRQSAVNHTTIAEMIKEKIDSFDFMDELACEQEFLLCSDVDKPSPYIEDIIAKKEPFKTVIRLICMQSIAGSGLKPKLLDYYKREICQVYGIDKLLIIGNLERGGLLKVQTGSRTYTVLRKTLKLTVDNPVEISPVDISYVHSCYAPLSIRIIEQHLKPSGWQSLNDILASLPGKLFEDYQSPGNSFSGRRGSINSEQSSSDVSRVILVFFLGGCTFAEISALRFLASQEDNNVEFLIATTKLVNKNTFLDCFIDKLKE